MNELSELMKQIQDAQKDIEAAEVILKAIKKYLEEKELL